MSERTVSPSGRSRGSPFTVNCMATLYGRHEPRDRFGGARDALLGGVRSSERRRGRFWPKCAGQGFAPKLDPLFGVFFHMPSDGLSISTDQVSAFVEVARSGSLRKAADGL